jgi:hypothetical protein
VIYTRGPFVNINGNSRENLVDQAFEVSAKAESLLQALGRASPHGRDYQTRGSDEDYKHDRKLWEMRVTYVRALYDEYRGIGERLYLEGKERERK